jgi:hypothetical protein
MKSKFIIAKPYKVENKKKAKQQSHYLSILDSSSWPSACVLNYSRTIANVSRRRYLGNNFAFMLMGREGERVQSTG